MAHIHPIDEAQATGTIKKIYDDAMSRAGYIANIIKVTSLDDATCLRSIQFYVALMKGDNALDAADREMLATVVSNANGCFY